MTPEQLAKSNSEHGHQRALFAWVNMARRFGFAAADDEQCYTVKGYVFDRYGEPNTRGCGTVFIDTVGPDAVEELEWFHAIANGGKREAITAAMLKAEGVKKGICDCFLPVPMRARSSTGLGLTIPTLYCGLYIEMKRPKIGKQTAGALKEEQTAFVAYARKMGYGVSVCFTWRDAANELKSYIETVRANK